jgi:hypothetical protein
MRIVAFVFLSDRRRVLPYTFFACHDTEANKNIAVAESVVCCRDFAVLDCLKHIVC